MTSEQLEELLGKARAREGEVKSLAMQQVNDFIAANDKSPVVEGSVLDLTVGGAFYELEDGSCFKLYVDECQLLPEGYPKWKL